MLDALVPAIDHSWEKRRRTREVFVPLAHSLGHAQIDFGKAISVIGGVQCKLHYVEMALPYADAFFTEAFCDGHVSAFGWRQFIKHPHC